MGPTTSSLRSEITTLPTTIPKEPAATLLPEPSTATWLVGTCSESGVALAQKALPKPTYSL
jgi:hypothetical protein